MYSDLQIKNELLRQAKKLTKYELIENMIPSAISSIQIDYKYGYDIDAGERKPGIRQLVREWLDARVDDARTSGSEYIKEKR